TWEFCTDAFFRGNCRVLGPGEYPELGGQDNRISSARLVAEGRRGWGQGGGGWVPPGREWSGVGHGDVQLFHGQGFNGFLANLDADVPNFQPLGFNDKVGSLIVRRGVWEFCTDAGFRGSCRTFTPGEYPDLGGHKNKYSSARPIAGPHRLEHR
ncbi:MAG TPA: beta/gamma crystallin-related protein, partial [Usitatibacter sp.]|nr:beta/gamma crystallin-related protein [Usitatibacter sp.]